MIEVNAATAIMLYLLFTLTFLCSFWGYYHYKMRHKKVIIAKDVLFLCEFCHFAYLENRAKEVTKCPSCKSYNKNNRY